MQQVKVRNAKHRRTRAYPVLVLIVLLLLIPSGVLQGAELLRARPQTPSLPPRTIRLTDVNPYGGNFFLHLEVEEWKIDKTLQMAAQAGLGWVKQQFSWESIEKSPGKFFDDRYNRSTWERYELIVSTAAKYGLQVIARLDRPPPWAREPDSTPMSPPRDYADFGRFAYEVAKHFKGRVRFYQIWNEPNLTEEWGGKPIDPEAYVELLRVAYREIKRADPNAYVLSAPLAQTVENNPAHMSDVAFLEEMYKHGAQPYFDILFANAYGFDRPPEDPPDPQILNFSRVLLLREVMERHGDAAKPVWFNEFGWNAAPEDWPADRLLWRRVSEPEQAEYTVRAIEMARREWPWAGVFNIWFFRQAGHLGPDDAQYYFRMVDVGFTPRLVYRSVQEAALPLQAAGPGRFQETNPALVPLTGWRYLVDAGAEAEGIIASASTGDKAAITFNGGSIALVAQMGPDAGRLYLALDGNGVAGLPRDEDGRSYVDLYSPAPIAQAVFPIVDGLGPGTHRLEMVVGAESDPRSAGRRVAVDAFVVGEASPFPWLQTTAGLLAVATVLGLVVWRRRRGFAAESDGGDG